MPSSYAVVNLAEFIPACADMMGGVKWSLAELHPRKPRTHLSNTRPFLEGVAQDPTIRSLQPFTLTQLNLPLCNHGQD
jgi:hypothetical protein